MGFDKASGNDLKREMLVKIFILFVKQINPKTNAMVKMKHVVTGFT